MREISSWPYTHTHIHTNTFRIFSNSEISWQSAETHTDSLCETVTQHLFVHIEINGDFFECDRRRRHHTSYHVRLRFSNTFATQHPHKHTHTLTNHYMNGQRHNWLRFKMIKPKPDKSLMISELCLLYFFMYVLCRSVHEVIFVGGKWSTMPLISSQWLFNESGLQIWAERVISHEIIKKINNNRWKPTNKIQPIVS